MSGSSYTYANHVLTAVGWIQNGGRQFVVVYYTYYAGEQSNWTERQNASEELRVDSGESGVPCGRSHRSDYHRTLPLVSGLITPADRTDGQACFVTVSWQWADRAGNGENPPPDCAVAGVRASLPVSIAGLL